MSTVGVSIKLRVVHNIKVCESKLNLEGMSRVCNTLSYQRFTTHVLSPATSVECLHCRLLTAATVCGLDDKVQTSGHRRTEAAAHSVCVCDLRHVGVGPTCLFQKQ